MTVAPVHSSALPSPLLPSEVREDLIAYAEAGGFTLRAETNPWFAALDSVARLDEARAASTVLAELRGSDVPELAEAADRLGEVPGLDTPTTAARTAAAVALLQRIRETLTVLRPEAYAAGPDTLKSLAAATGSSAWRVDQGVSQSWWRRSRLGRHARGLAAGRVRREDLHRALDTAATARADWSELALSGGQPSLPGDLSFVDAAARAADAALTGLDALAALIRPTTPLGELPLATLATLLDDLAADEGTLYRLPRLHELREKLTSLGHGQLLAELTSRQADADATEAYLAERAGEASEVGALAEPDEELVAEDAADETVTELESESLTELPDQRQDEAETATAAAADAPGEESEPAEAAASDVDEADAAELVATLPEQRQEEAEVDAPAADTEPTAVTETQAEIVPTTEDGADVTTDDAPAEPIAALPDQRRKAAPAAEAETAEEETAEAVAEIPAEIEDAADAPAELPAEAEPIAEDTVEAEVEENAEAQAEVEAPAADAEAEPVAEDAVEAEVEENVEAHVEPVAETAAEAESQAPAAEDAVEPVAEFEETVEAPLDPVAEIEVEAVAAEAEAEADVEPVAEAEVEAEVEAEADVEPVAEAPAEGEPAAEVEAQPEIAAYAADAPAVPAGKPEIVAGRPVTAYAPEELEALVRWLDADGTVRTDDELLRAAMKELGFSRLGPRIKDALGAAVAAARG